MYCHCNAFFKKQYSFVQLKFKFYSTRKKFFRIKLSKNTWEGWRHFENVKADEQFDNLKSDDIWENLKADDI